MNRYNGQIDLTHSSNLLKILNEARSKPDELTNVIRECDDIINDCHHYLEMYVLKAPQQQKITNVLRETLRKKRKAQDERVLIGTALAEIDGKPHRERDRSFEFHYDRIINDNRSYRPKRISLEQILGIEPEVSPETQTNTKFQHLSRFTSTGLK